VLEKCLKNSDKHLVFAIVGHMKLCFPKLKN
jgi:hypothetical protein